MDALDSKQAQKVAWVMQLVEELVPTTYLKKLTNTEVMLKEAREAAGITQEELAIRLSTKKSAISRMENHAEDIKLSTLEKFASSIGKSLEVRIY